MTYLDSAKLVYGSLNRPFEQLLLCILNSVIYRKHIHFF